jgi:N-acetylglucosaminyldiphosphoundecaprenol N-acetyl-beta-D-mannosaminyltransferase
MAHYLSSHAEYPHGFIGGKEGQALSLEQRFGIRSISYVTPHRPFSAENARHDWEEFLKRCPERRPPPVVWVCLGAPKQELWMKEIAALAPGVLFFGVGAAFDFLTGAKSRAPRWMQKSGMEWLHRLLQEPGRLAKRYLFSNALFAWLLLRECLSRRSA